MLRQFSSCGRLILGTALLGCYLTLDLTAQQLQPTDVRTNAARDVAADPPTAELMRELHSLREDSRRLLEILEKRSPREVTFQPAEPVENKLGLEVAKRQRQMFVLRPVHLDLRDTMELCQAMLDIDDRGVCRTIEKDRRLVLVCYPETFEIISQRIMELDVAPTYVMIKAALCQVPVEELDNANLRVGAAPAPTWPQPQPVRSTAANPAKNPVASSRSPDELIEDLKQKCPGLKILARPSLMVADGQAAEIRIITEIPVQQLTQTETGANIGTTVFREAGIVLKLEPTIYPDHSLAINLESEVSALREKSEHDQPIIDRRQMTTVLRLENGGTTMSVGLARGLPPGLRDHSEAGAAKEMDTVLIVSVTAVEPISSAERAKR